MSQPLQENIGVSNPGNDTAAGIGGPQDLDPPESARNQESRGTSDFVDGSGKIFSMYLGMAKEEDEKMAENWKDDADGILIFTGLFSAAVASLISVSIQDLQQNPQDTSNFYLANMYQATINPNKSSSLPTSPPPFTPPNFAIWVNALWFLSLVISITCALLATLLQQWARRYLKVTQPRYSLHRRARIRAFFFEGVDKFLLPWAVEALPTMLHLSLFLFFAGLAVFLWNINLTIFKLVLSWIGLCTALYGCITFIPIFRHDSPYQTPLSLPVWHLIKGIPFLTFRALETITYFHSLTYAIWCYSRKMAECYRKLLAQGMRKMAEETAFNSPSEIDTRAFLWTFDSLDEDHELESFFSGLPGFRSSKVVKDPLPDLTSEEQGKLLNALIGLFDRTSSSDLLPEHVKLRRTIVCRKAISPADIPRAIPRFLSRIFSEDQDGQAQSTEFACYLKGWGRGQGEETPSIIRSIVLSVIARAQLRDYLWFAMASDEMGVPESVLQNHATHGNDLSLAILIHVVRQQFSLLWEPHWPETRFSIVLFAASKFDVLYTSSELQHEFCALWNEVVRKCNAWHSWHILRPIRNIYLTLHLHTDSAPIAFDASTDDEDRILWFPFAYPSCKIPAHRPDSTPHIHNAATPTAVAHANLLDNAALVPSSLASTPNEPSPSIPSPIRIDEKTMDDPLLNNDISAPASSHSAHQPAAENVSDSATSPEPLAATAGATLDTDTPARPIPTTTSETSTSTASVHPTSEHSLQNIADLHVHSDTSEIPSPGPPELVLDDITESRCSILATTPPDASPSSLFALELGTSEDGPVASSHEDEDTLDPPQANHAIQATAMTILDRPPSPTLPSATDITIASQGLDAEHTGDPPPRTSRSQYDIL